MEAPTLSNLTQMQTQASNSLRDANYNKAMSGNSHQANSMHYENMDHAKHTTNNEAHKQSSYGMSGGVGALIIWFFVIFIVTWLVLYALKPSLVMKPNGKEVDTGRVLLGAAIISLVIIIIVWLFKGCAKSMKY